LIANDKFKIIQKENLKFTSENNHLRLQLSKLDQALKWLKFNHQSQLLKAKPIEKAVLGILLS
jgi:hypothetical protein